MYPGGIYTFAQNLPIEEASLPGKHFC